MKIIRFILIFYLLFCEILLKPLDAVILTLDRNINLRQNSVNGILEIKHHLPKGTRVEIPNEFIRESGYKGDLKDEMALINWLKNAGNLKRIKINGAIKQDYFFPIKVVSTPDGRFPVGITGEIAIRFLARHNNIQLVVVKDSLFIPAQKSLPNNSGTNTKTSEKTYASKTSALLQKSTNNGKKIFMYDIIRESLPSNSETNTKTSEKTDATKTSTLLQKSNNNGKKIFMYDIIRDCPTDNKISEILTPIHDALKNVYQQIESKLQKSVSTEEIRNNFNMTCGYDFDMFLEKLISEAKKNNIPSDLLLSIMTQESRGRCDAINRELRRGSSTGLFQIYTPYVPNYANCPILTTQDLIMGLRYENKCLQNPLTNLKLSIQNLKNKYRVVNGTYPSNLYAYGSLSSEEKNLWSKALSAYNGGEAYVIQAFHDIKSFNNQYKVNLDPNDWTTRRAFMFRNLLEENSLKIAGKTLKFNNRHKYKRKFHNTLSNMAFVGSILDRHMKTWHSYLEKKEFYL